MKHNPHDALVKAAFGLPENAQGEFKAALPPELSAGIDWTTLKRENGSFIDEELADTHSDLLFSAQLKDFPALLYIVFEHKSYPKTLLPLDMARYCLNVLGEYIKLHGSRLPLPPVVPVVLYHHPRPHYRGPRKLSHLFGKLPERIPGLRRYLPDLELCLDNLTNTNDSELRAREMSPFAKLVLWALRDARTRGKVLKTLNNWSPEWNTLAPDDRNQLMHYIYEVDPTTAEDLDTALTEEATMAQSGTKSALQLLIDEGKLEGKLEGQVATLHRQLRLKFGSLDPTVEPRLQNATAEELELWADRILTADSVEGVLR